MIAPDSPAKPEMWSAWRWVATSMSSLPLPFGAWHSSRIFCAIAVMPPAGPKRDAFVEPKSISTLRGRPAAYVNVRCRQSPKPVL